jgi:hypothetical protein
MDVSESSNHAPSSPLRQPTRTAPPTTPTRDAQTQAQCMSAAQRANATSVGTLFLSPLTCKTKSSLHNSMGHIRMNAQHIFLRPRVYGCICVLFAM